MYGVLHLSASLTERKRVWFTCFETKVPPKQNKWGNQMKISTKANILRSKTPNSKVQIKFFNHKMQQAMYGCCL